MDPLIFTYGEMMKVAYNMIHKLPAPNACTNEQLDELWDTLLDEYYSIVDKIDNVVSKDCSDFWETELRAVEKDLEAVDYEWLRRRPTDLP